MAAQKQVNPLVGKLATRVAAGAKQHQEKPMEVGRARMPAGVRNGVAQLTQIGYGTYSDQGQNKALHGQQFLRFAGVAHSPEAVNGFKVQGIQTAIIIPMCDTPNDKNRKTFEDHWNYAQSIFEMFGIGPPPLQLQGETQQQAGVRIATYYDNAIKALVGDGTAPGSRPFFYFSTRGWTPPKTADKPNPTEMVFEEWTGICAIPPGASDPGAAVSDGENHMNPEPFNEFGNNGTEGGAVATGASDEDLDALAVLADSNPDVKTASEEGKDAMHQLRAAALAAGFTDAQVDATNSWSEVATMAKIGPTEMDKSVTPQKGQIYNWIPRNAAGTILKDKQGADRLPLEVEVLTVNEAAKTCTAKTRDGKPIIGADKKPLQVKFEWLTN